MAIAFRSSTHGTTSTSTRVQPAIPTGATQDDILLDTFSSVAPSSEPVGYIQLDNPSGSDHWHRFATGDGTPTFTVTKGSYRWESVAYSGCITDSTVINAHTGGASLTTMPTVTPTVANTVVVAFLDNGGGSVTLPSPWVARDTAGGIKVYDTPGTNGTASPASAITGGPATVYLVALAPVASAVTNPLTLTASQNQLNSISNAVNHLFSVSQQQQQSSLTNQSNKTLISVQQQLLSDAKQITHFFPNAIQNQTISLVSGISHLLSLIASQHQAVVFAKSINKTFTLQQQQLTSILRSVARTLTLTQRQLSITTKAVTHSAFTASQHQASVLSRSSTKFFTPIQNQVSSFSKSIAKNLTLKQNQLNTLSKNLSHILSAAQNQTALFTRVAAHLVTLLAVQRQILTPPARVITKGLAAVQNLFGSAGVGSVHIKVLTAAQKQFVVLNTGLGKLITLTASQFQASSLTKSSGKVFPIVLNQNSALTKRTARVFSSIQNQLALSPAKALSKVLFTSQHQIAVVNKTITKAITLAAQTLNAAGTTIQRASGRIHNLVLFTVHNHLASFQVSKNWFSGKPSPGQPNSPVGNFTDVLPSQLILPAPTIQDKVIGEFTDIGTIDQQESDTPDNSNKKIGTFSDTRS